MSEIVIIEIILKLTPCVFAKMRIRPGAHKHLRITSAAAMSRQSAAYWSPVKCDRRLSA